MNGGLAPLIWISAALLSAVFLWRIQARRSNATGRSVRWPGWLLWMALFGLGWLSWQPQVQEHSLIVVLSLGTTEAEVRTLLKNLGSDARVLALPEVAHLQESFPDIEVIPDVAWLLRTERGPGPYHLLGWGIPPEELANAPARSWTVHPSPLPLGFAHAHWPRSLVLGQTLRVTGRLGQPAEHGWSVQLRSPAGDRIASAELDPGSDSFELGTVPVTSGALVFTLEVVDENQGVLIGEKLPVVIEEPEKLEVWAILGAPRFELKFLRNWLGQAGSAMALRTQLTDTEWRDETVNRAPMAEGLALRDWSQADVLILDYLALQRLGSDERAVIRKEVERGMGLLCMPEGLDAFLSKASPSAAAFFAPWQLTWEEEGIDMLQAQLFWSGSPQAPNVKVPHLPAKLHLTEGLAPLVQDTFGAVLAGVTPRGEGLIALSVVRDTQQLILAGEMSGFATYWSRVLGALARPKASTSRWHMTQPVRVGEPGTWSVSSNNPQEASLGTTRERLYWETDRLKAGTFSGKVWMEDSGWHLPIWGESPLQPFYVHSADAWLYQVAQSRLATMPHLENGQPMPPQNPRAAVGPWLWGVVLLFMAIAAWVWLGEKLGRL